MQSNPPTQVDYAGLLSQIGDLLKGVSPAGVAAELAGLSRFIDALQALALPLTLMLDKHDEHYSEGYRTPGYWLRKECRLGATAAGDRLEMARRLDRLPVADAALSAGEIGFQHARDLFRLAEKVGYEAVGPHEAELVGQARNLDPTTYARYLQHFRAMVDPDGILDDARMAHETRFLSMSSTMDGVFYLKGKLDADAGSVVEAALVALTPAHHPGDWRSPGNRRADALVDMARTVLDSGSAPEVAGERPHVTLTVSAETMAWLSLEPAEIGNGLPVPVETASRHLCDAMVTLIELDRKGNPLNMGRTRRTVTAKQRKALNLRDRGCRFPGCDRPWWWTDAHHLIAWEFGGPSDLDNLILLCRHHHKLVHEGGWTIDWNDERDGIFAMPPNRALCRSG